MNFLFNPWFWGITLGVYLLQQLTLPLRRTQWFGLLNAVAICLLLGWKVFVGAGLMAILLWVFLWTTLRQETKKRTGLALAGLASTVLVFVLHKGSLQSFTWSEVVAGALPWGEGARLLHFLVLLSFSYVFLRVVDLIRTVLWGSKKLLDPLSLVGYLFPFHMLVAGPITAYAEHLKMNEEDPPEPQFRLFLKGINILTSGLFYKFVFAESIRLYAFGVGGEIHAEGAWETAVVLVYLFFDFAGYSRVALGIGQLCLVPTPDNFKAPYLATSITNFWTRWHVSLGNFIRMNIFNPLQLWLARRWGSDKITRASLLSLVASFAFTALWHRISWTFLAWGLAIGVILCVEKYVRDRCLKTAWAQHPRTLLCVRIVGPIYVFVINALSLQFVIGEILHP